MCSSNFGFLGSINQPYQENRIIQEAVRFQVYEGEFVEDKRSGTGSYSWPSGDRFQGEFVDDAKDGKGEFFFSNGNVFKVGGGFFTLYIV